MCAIVTTALAYRASLQRWVAGPISAATDLDLEPPAADPWAQDPPRRGEAKGVERDRGPVRSLEHHERRTGPRDAHRDVVAAERRDHVRDLGHRCESAILVQPDEKRLRQERRIARQRLDLDRRASDVRGRVPPEDALGPDGARRRRPHPEARPAEGG